MSDLSPLDVLFSRDKLLDESLISACKKFIFIIVSELAMFLIFSNTVSNCLRLKFIWFNSFGGKVLL